MKGRLVVCTLLATVALAGCSSPKIPTTVGSKFPVPSGAAPVPSRSLPPATHKWSVSALKCPRLTSDAARRLDVAGDGTQTRGNDIGDIGKVIDCRWGPSDASGTAVEAALSAWDNQAGADAGWQLDSSGLSKPEPLTGVGEEAFLSQPLGRPGIQASVRSGNAIIIIKLIPAAGAPSDVTPLREAAPAIAGDMLDDLVPA